MCLSKQDLCRERVWMRNFSNQSHRSLVYSCTMPSHDPEMLHHVSLADLGRSAAFYDAVLEPLGYARVWADSSAVGYGRPGGADQFAIKKRGTPIQIPGDGFHLAFAAT